MTQLRYTITGEYPADPKWYPGTDGDPVKMAAMDQRMADEGELDVANLLDFNVTSVVIESAEPVGIAADYADSAE